MNLKWEEVCKKDYCFNVNLRTAFDRMNPKTLINEFAMCGVFSRFVNIV